MESQRKIIGIVGGLGPFAHLDFERKLLEAAQDLLGARRDQDYPEWIVSSVPQTPDRTRAIQGDADDPFPWLLRSLRRLTRGGGGAPGAGVIAIPCNTAHLYLPQLRAETSVPILDMIAESARAVRNTFPGGCAGILATTGTLEAGLYHRALEAEGIRAISPLDLDATGPARELVMEAVYGPLRGGRREGGGIKAHGKRPEFTALLEQAAHELIGAGAEVLIAGCTEIPIAIDTPEVGGVPLVDPTRLLAEAAIRAAYEL